MWENKTFIDLTHTLHEGVPTWTGTCGFSSIVKQDYGQGTGITKFKVENFRLRAGIGTHMDAPCHCMPKGLSIDQLPLKNFFAKLNVIDISNRATPDYTLSIDDVKEFETLHGKIEKDSFVAVYTGWAKFWNQLDRYRNEINGIMHFPSISEEAALLLNSKEIVGIGIDTLSPDAPSTDYPVHCIYLGANKYIVENMAQLDKMPATGGYIICLPIKAGGATEAPIRCVGIY